jgi:hypothetical protein
MPLLCQNTMKTFALIFLNVLAVSHAFGEVLAGPITNAANGHFYYLLKTATWTNSEAQAVKLGGHLVTINDAAENAWVAQAFAKSDRQDRPLWIGLTDRDSEGIFVWVNGERTAFLNWNTESGEPNNSAGSGYEEDFAYMIEGNPGNSTLIPGQWNDAPDTGFGVARPVCGVVEVEPAVSAEGAVRGAAFKAPWLILFTVLGSLLLGTVLLLIFLVRSLRAKRS